MLVLFFLISISYAQVMQLAQQAPLMQPYVSIQAANIGKMGQHNKNCTIHLDDHVILYCESEDDYFLQFGTIENLFNAADSYQMFNGHFAFNEALPYVRQYGRFVSFIDPVEKTFNEVEWIDENYYYPVRPYYIDNSNYRSDQNMTIADDEAEPEVIMGLATQQMVLLVVKHRQDVHFELYRRYYSVYFSLEFQMNNENRNMIDPDLLKGSNETSNQTAEEQPMNMTVTAIDYMQVDGKHYAFVATSEEGNTTKWINKISFYNVGNQQRTEQKSYWFETGRTNNCADLIRATNSLFVVVCKSNGAVSIFKRDASEIYTSEALVEIKGEEGAKWTADNIAFIEHEDNRETFTQTYVFITQRGDDQDRPKILAWEILINYNSSQPDDKPYTSLVIELTQFEQILLNTYNAENYGNNLNLAANLDVLLLNYEFFSEIKVYLFCGFKRHFDLEQELCVHNQPGWWSLDLAVISPPFEPEKTTWREYDTLEIVSTDQQILHTCQQNPFKLAVMDQASREKLQFICSLNLETGVSNSSSVEIYEVIYGENEDLSVYYTYIITTIAIMIAIILLLIIASCLKMRRQQLLGSSL